MIHSLRLRLLLTMVAVAAVTAGTVALLARQTTVSEFQRYVALNAQRNQRMGALFGQAATLRVRPAGERQSAVLGLAADLGERVVLADEEGRILADSAGDSTATTLDDLPEGAAAVVQFAPAVSPQHLLDAAPVIVSETVRVELPAPGVAASGSMLFFAEAAPGLGDGAPTDQWQVQLRGPDELSVSVAPLMVRWRGQAGTDPIQAGFISGVNRSLGMALLVAGLAAFGLTMLVSRRILGPVEALTAAARRMEQGDLSQRVEVRARDEIAQLAGAFNAMAAGLERLEHLRRHMVTDVAHELRTPLTNIRGYLEALRDGVAEPEPAMIESLHEEALLLNRLIDDLQDLALAEAGQLRLRRRPTNLGAVAAQVLAAARPRLEAKGVACQIDLPDDLPVVDADPERLGQVLRNLLDNALTHTPEGGQITLSAERVSAPEPALLVGVSDTGCGIPSADLPNIFERFYRADPSRARATGGAGLGLTIVRRLVEAHGGRAWAESSPGAGATLRFTLPLPPD